MTQPKRVAPRLLLARLTLYLVGTATAVFGALGWIAPEIATLTSPGLSIATLPWAALVLAALTGLSAAVVPVSCEIIGRSLSSVLLIPAALVFGGINAYSFHHAVDALIEAPRVEVFNASVLDPLKADLMTANAAVTAHAVPTIPETMGPRNIAARMDAFDRVHAPLMAAAQAAQARMDNLPPLAPLAPSELIWLIAAMIDLSLAAGLTGIGLVRASAQRKIDAELLALVLAKRQARRERQQAAALEAERLAKRARRTKRAVPTNKGPNPESPAPVARPPMLRVVA